QRLQVERREAQPQALAQGEETGRDADEDDVAVHEEETVVTVMPVAAFPRAMRWATRARPHVDRCGTAWLIRRFVDPGAQFVFVAPGGEAPKDATPFDMPGVEYGHKGGDCTFETTMKKHALEKDAA